MTPPHHEDRDPLHPIPSRLLDRATAHLESASAHATALTDGTSTHRALGRFVRDSVTAELAPPLASWRAARDGAAAERSAQQCAAVLHELRKRQSEDGTFHGGDNVNSPPDTAFTVNDLAAASMALRSAGELGPIAMIEELLAELLSGTAGALSTGGVHTPNHRWELSSALTRLGEVLADPACTARARQWLAEGIDLQPDGMFSERSPNYAAHVSVPSLLTMGALLDEPQLARHAVCALRTHARLTGVDGMVETLASRRQDQFAPFDGGALYPWFRAVAATFDDDLCARAADRTRSRADADAVLTLLAHGLEEPRACGVIPLPAATPSNERPAVVELTTSRLARVEYDETSTVVFAGTDTARAGRIGSGLSSNPTFLRFMGRSVGISDIRLSRDFFNLGPVRFEELSGVREHDDSLSLTMTERATAAYFHPLPPEEVRDDGDYPLEFNGRFSAAMSFSGRARSEVVHATVAEVTVRPDRLTLDISVDGPPTALCLAIRLTGGTFDGTRADAGGRVIPADLMAAGTKGPGIDGGTDDVLSSGRRASDEENIAQVSYGIASESLHITARGALQGPAFYEPGEAYTFLRGSDELTGDVLYVPVRSHQPLRLDVRREERQRVTDS